MEISHSKFTIYNLQLILFEYVPLKVGLPVTCLDNKCFDMNARALVASDKMVPYPLPS